MYVYISNRSFKIQSFRFNYLIKIVANIIIILLSNKHPYMFVTRNTPPPKKKTKSFLLYMLKIKVGI